MPWDKSWPPPSTTALALIERVFRLSSSLRVMEIDPAVAGVAMLISTKEAFVLLDHLKGPWRTAVWNRTDVFAAPEEVHLDLATAPEPGLQWGTMFGITLIVQSMPLDTPHD